jgi:hypothetical protein
MTPQLITVNSRWIHKQVPIEIVVVGISFREVSFLALNKNFSGTLSRWLFLQDFQP